MLSLLALGTAFQVRLIGQVIAAHADRLDEPDEHGRSVDGHSIRPVLTAALDGPAGAGRRAVARHSIRTRYRYPCTPRPGVGFGMGFGRADRAWRAAAAAGQPARLVAGAGVGLRAGADRQSPGRRGRTRGLAGRAGPGPACPGHRAGPARRARPGWPAGRTGRGGRSRAGTAGGNAAGDGPHWESMSTGNPAAEALGVAVAARVPVLLWGAPGTGKTSVIRAMAGAMGLAVRDRDLLDPRAVGFRRPAHRGRATKGPVRTPRPGPGGWPRPVARAAVP